MPRGGEVVVILWRDIPAQVNGRTGRDRHQVLLSDKFQRAIDRAKRKAHVYTAQEDVAQWRRVSRPLERDAAADAADEAARLEADYTRERLGRLAFAGGWERDIDMASATPADLVALEELGDEDGPPGSSARFDPEKQDP